MWQAEQTKEDKRRGFRSHTEDYMRNMSCSQVPALYVEKVKTIIATHAVT